MRLETSRSPIPAALAVALVAALAAATLAPAPVHAAADLRITSMTVQGTPRVGTCNKVDMTVRNDGDAFTGNATLDIRLITFPSATPFQNRVQKDLFISPIQPGNQTSFTINDVEFKASGAATVQAVVDSTNETAETNENNNAFTLTTTVSGECYQAPPPPPPPPSACDLSATFTAPSGSSALSGAINFVVRFKSEGKGGCAGNKVKLMRYNSSRCSGYGSQVGGSRNLQALNPLSPGQTQDIGFTDKVTKGTYCYKVVYSSPHNDTNNYNHHPTKTLQVQ